MAFKVNHTVSGEVSYPDSAKFSISDNGVLAITDGTEVIHYSPSAWISVRSAVEPGEIW